MKPDINLSEPYEDPFSLIVENRSVVEKLLIVGVDSKKIGEMLQNYHGLTLKGCGFGWGNQIDEVMNKEKTNYPTTATAIWLIHEGKLIEGYPYDDWFKKHNNAIRKLGAVVKDRLVLKEIQELVEKEIARLKQQRDQFKTKEKSSDQFLHPREKDANPKARSIVQMTGMQVYDIYEYIKPFVQRHNDGYGDNDGYFKDTDVFNLIAELLNVTCYINTNDYNMRWVRKTYFNTLRLF